MGRLSKFTQSLADDICDKLILPISLREICRDKAMPPIGTVMRWLNDNQEFREQYARAKVLQSDVIAEETQEIVDDGRNDWIERMDKSGEPTGTYALNGEAVARSRLRFDQRRWYLSKLAPKKYGDKIEHEVTGEIEITVRIGGVDSKEL